MPEQLPFRIRRSAVPGKRPQNADLDLGELALNTYDVRLFAKKDTGGVGIGTTVALLTPWTETVGVGIYYTEGNIGLGTTNPTSRLWVSGDINFTGNLYQNGGLFVSGGGSSQWTTYAAGISTTSNVGIGTTNPTTKLQVNGSVTLGASSTDLITIPGRIASNFYPDGDGVYDIGRPTQIGSGANRWKNANFSGKGTFDSGVNAHDIELGVSSANLIYSTFGNLELNSQSGTTNIDDKVTISGNTGIGTANPTSKLHVIGDANISGIITTSSIKFSTGAVLGDVYDDGGFGLKSAPNQYATIASDNLQQFVVVDDSRILIGAAYTGDTNNYKYWNFDKNGDITFPDNTKQYTAFTGYANTAGIATYATSAGTATTALGFSTTANINTSGIITASRFVGSLTGTATTATNLSDAANITTGTISSSRLSGSYGISITGTATTATTLADAANITTGTISSSRLSGSYGISITGTATTATTLADAANITTGTISKDRISTTGALTVLGDLYVSNNISFGGTTTQLNLQQLQIDDADIVLGIGTSFSPTDNTANHGGIAIASTEGTPLVNLNIVPGEINPYTYKKIMWFKGSTIGAGLTDAWLFNYGVGIGSTQVPYGVRLAVGQIKMTDSAITATTFTGNLTGTATTATNLTDAANITTGTISSSRLSGSYGIDITGTATTANNLSDAANITTGTISSSRLSGSYGIDITGTATTAIYATTAGVSTSVVGGIGSITQLRVSGISTLGISTFTGNVSFGSSASFGDNINLNFGNTNNLKIYSIGANGFIDASTGLILKSTSTTYQGDVHTFQNSDQTKTYATFISSGSAFYQNNNTRLQIIGAGITVTGTTFTNQLSVSGVTTSTGGFVGSLTGTATTATTALGFSTTASINTSGIITASSFVKSSGTSSQFLKADGSSDSNTYLTTTGSGTNLTGIVTSIVAGTNITVSGSTGQVTINAAPSSGSSSQWTTYPTGISTTSNVGIGTTNATETLSVLGKIQILQKADSTSRLIFRGVPGTGYRWNIDNDSSNLFRIFSEDDATAANGAVRLSISTTGTVTAAKFVGDGSGLTAITATGSGVVVQNQGSNVGTAATLNFSTNLSASFASGTATISLSNNPSISGILTADQVYTSNNGNGTNIRIGDDLWLGDINVANTTRLSGAQDGTQAFIVFGSSNSVALGRTGTGPLYYGGNFTSAGIITASQLVSNVAQGTAPITVGSSTLVTNLNANYLNGQPDTYYTNASNLTGTISSSRLSGSYGISITGTATTATTALGFSTTASINTSGIITASSFVKTSGTSSQFLKADGSSDSNTYLTTTGSGTNLTGIVTSIVAGTNITVSGSTGQVTINAGTPSQWTTYPTGISTTSNVGIGTTNATSTLTVVGDASVSGLTTTNNLNVTGVGTFLSSGLRIRNPANTFNYIITGGVITTADRILNLPVITGTDTVATLGLSQTFSNTNTFSGTLSANSTALISLSGSAVLSHSFGTNQTSGTLTFGGTSGTGLITFGRATTSQQTDIQAGATASGNTKTINFGTGGLSGSNTQINIGPTAGVGTVAINSGTNLGIGSTTPTSKLDVVGDAKFTGVVTATTFSGNATSATYASTAGISTALQNARNFSITGNFVTATAISFDGTGNVALAATITPDSIGLGTYTSGDYLKNITGTSNQITITGGTGEGSTPTLSIPNQFTVPQDLTVTRDVQVNRNLNVTGNITIGGTAAYINVQQLQVADADLVLGFRTDAFGNDVSNDNTAQHGGIAIASTEGTPLVSLYNPGIGESTLPTYKKFMWFKTGNFTGLGTDAWLSNYAIGIGSTQFPSGTRLAAGSVQFTENDLAAVRNINASGVVTATTFIGALTGTATSTTNIPNLSGDVSSNNTVTTLATVNSNVGTYGDAGAIPSVTVNAKGLVTGVTTVAPNNGQLSLAVSGTGLSGSATFTANQSGSSTFTVTSNATDTNTPSTIVARDASGNFSAGTITANLTGTATTATTANNVSSSININTSGIITASSFVKTSGTSSQFLKADGSSDSNTYLTTTGSGTNLTGIVTSIVAGTNITVSGSTGQVTINATSSSGSSSQWTTYPTGISTTSNVGIGTTNATETLTVLGNTSVSGIITATELDLTGNASTDSSILYLSGAPLGTSTKNGLLGIGQLSFSDTDIVANFTHNVNSYAQVILQNKNSGASASSDFIVNNDRTAGTTYYGDFGINGTTFSGGGPFGDPDGTYLYSSGGTLSLGSIGLNTVRFAVNNVEAARLDTSGNLGIGTTIPTSKLHVVGGVLVTGVTTSTDFNSSSDINLKDNIQRIENPIDKVLQLDGVTFNWKSNQRPSVGVIAQQVEKVLPQLVSGDYSKTVNYNGLIGLLIEAIKEQQNEIEVLKKYLNK